VARRRSLVALLAIGSLWLAWSAPEARQLTGCLHVESRDLHTDALVPARFYLTDSTGAARTPPGVIAYDKRDEHHFVADAFKLDLPPGRYRLVVERGPEYTPMTMNVDLADGVTHRETVHVQRWVDMNDRGWFSGDLHNHRRVEEMPLLLLAEDLNVAPTITDWIWEDRAIATPPLSAEPLRAVDNRHVFSVFDKEVERLETGPGAIALLGLRAPIPFEGYRLFPPDDVYSRRAREQGGYIDAEKIVWRDGAALAALELIDFVGIVHNHFNRQDVELETARWGMIPKSRPEFDTVAGMPLWSMEVYYHLLNCGFRFPVSAGSASGVKAAPLGYNRVYVKMSGPFSYQNWFTSLKAGRSFATNGPMLLLSANGQDPGAVIRVTDATRPVRIRAEALSPRPLARLELVSSGQVIRSITTPDSGGRWVIEMDLSFAHNGWVIARAFEPAGRTIRFAHTSPIYVDAGVPAPAAADAKFFLAWIDREIAFYTANKGFRTRGHQDEMLALFRQAREVYARMVPNGALMRYSERDKARLRKNVQ
jgi:hypothetical protein